MAPYAPALLDEIRAGVDLVEIVGRVVHLKKAGASWKGLCPFHAEKTPSFMVNPRKGIFHCFGCGVGGDVFGFLMRQDRLSFPEAVRALARTAGVALPDEPGAARDSGREELGRIMELAARFFAEALRGPQGDRARAYLDARGIDPEVARRFGLGYAAEGWDLLLRFMRAEGVPAEAVVTAGLAVPRERGDGAYDRFRGRLIFPIRDLHGRVVAFGGRALGDEVPKYLNSPETPLYTKGNLLYAADLARPGQRERNRALLVEGYVDCLMAHQHGFTETVAALGTAFTAAQLALLRRSCEEVITFFDADAAGQKAAERAVELLEATGAGAAWAVNRTGGLDAGAPFRLKVALLPAGHDPDTFLRAHGAEAFQARIAAARSLLGYALDRAIAEPGGAAPGPLGRASAFGRVAMMLAKVADAEEAVALSRDAARQLGVDPTQLWIESRRLQATLARARPAAAPRSAPPTAVRAEQRALARLLLHRPRARALLLPLVDDEDLPVPALRAIVGALRARPDAAAESLLTDLDGDEARHLLAGLLVEEEDDPRVDPEAAVADFERRLRLARRLRRIRAVSRQIAEAAPGTPALEHLRVLERESREVHASTLRLAQAYPPGPASPQGVQTHE